MLEEVLNERKNDLVDYLTEISKKALSVREDKLMTGPVVKEIEKMKLNIQNYYLMNYQQFYDILFIDRQGEIFFTMKKQADYHKNIFQGNLSETALSVKLKNYPKESFVDFQFYD